MVIGALFLLPLIGFILLNLSICMLSIWEWGLLAGLTTGKQRLCLTILCGLLLIVITFTIPIYQPFIIVRQTSYILCCAVIWWLTAFMLVLHYPNSAVFWRTSQILRLVFGILIIFPFFWGMLVLRQYHYNINHFTGAWWLLHVLIIVWSLDSGAYIFGRILGRHKLAPKISPGKTWEGLIGGLLTSIIIACLFGKYAPLNISPLTLLICSIITALTSVLGDLTESMFKREVGIKDSGYFIPGHGGILDRIDGLTSAVAIFAFLMLLVFNIV